MISTLTRRLPFAPWASLLLLALCVPSVRAATAQTYYFFVFSDPAPGQEAEYNRWYDEEHIGAVVSIPGFTSAQRFVRSEIPFFRTPDVKMPKYVVVYTIASGDVASVFAEVQRRIDTGETTFSPSYDREHSQSYAYRVLGPELKGPGGEAPGARTGTKQDYIQLVFSAMAKGANEADFNAFYDRHHAREVVSIPGFLRAQRMMLERTFHASIPATKYSAMYWMRTSDPDAIRRAAASAQPAFTTSPAFDAQATRGYTYRAIGPVVDGDKVRAERKKR